MEADRVASAYVPTGRPLWSLTEDVSLKHDGERLVAHTRWGVVDIDDPSSLVREALHRMSLGPVALENVPALREPYLQWKSGRNDTCPEWGIIREIFDLLSGCVVPSLGLNDGNGPILSAVPVTEKARFAMPAVHQTSLVRLVTGYSIDDQRDTATLRAPSAAFHVELRAPATAVVSSLARAGRTVRALAVASGVHGNLVTDVVAYLAGAGVVSVSG